MFLLNLSLGEFLILFGTLSAFVIALYLLDRSRQKVVVATLRFWNQALRPAESRRRRRLRQWPSLLLQLLALALLTLALAQLRLGSRENVGRDHVLILDTSAWMAARTRSGSLMDRVRAQALAYLNGLPAGDRVMVIYAESLATPVTPFESERAATERAIRAARPGAGALNLQPAIDFAAQLQRKSARSAGEIVVAGAARILGEESFGAARPPANLRLLSVEEQPENAGIRKIGARQSATEAGLWQIFASARNYGTRPVVADLVLRFGGAQVGSRRLRLMPGADHEAAFEFRTRAAGLLETRLLARGDALANDNVAALELPPWPPLRVAVCSAQPELLLPLLTAHPVVELELVKPEDCGRRAAAGILILDGAVSGGPRKEPTIWIEPPPEYSPMAIVKTVSGASLRRWRSEHPLGAGLRALDVRVPQARILAVSPEDVVVAESDQGPLIVARPPRGAETAKSIVFGFHPMRHGLRFELSTPLLFANILRWMAPESFRLRELQAAGVGTVTVPLEPDTDRAKLQVAGGDGRPIPFTVQEDTLRFFCGSPGTVRVIAGDREHVYSLTLPDVADSVWQAPADVRRGLPGRAPATVSSRDIWHWLAVLGGLCLLVEWLKFGPVGPGSRRPRAVLRILRIEQGWRKWQDMRRRAS